MGGEGRDDGEKGGGEGDAKGSAIFVKAESVVNTEI